MTEPTKPWAVEETTSDEYGVWTGNVVDECTILVSGGDPAQEDPEHPGKTRDGIDVRLALAKRLAQVPVFEAVGRELLESEDNTGCTPDLTVVSREAIERLRAALQP